MLHRALVATLLGGLLCACGGTGMVPPAPATVTGQVQIRVCGGANRLGQPACQVRPYAGGALEFQLSPPAGKGSDRLAVTDASGRYTIVLPPGTWTVTAVDAKTSQQLPRPPAFPQAQGSPRQITVIPGKAITADFVYTIELL